MQGEQRRPLSLVFPTVTTRWQHFHTWPQLGLNSDPASSEEPHPLSETVQPVVSSDVIKM